MFRLASNILQKLPYSKRLLVFFITLQALNKFQSFKMWRLKEKEMKRKRCFFQKNEELWNKRSVKLKFQNFVIFCLQIINILTIMIYSLSLSKQTEQTGFFFALWFLYILHTRYIKLWSNF